MAEALAERRGVVGVNLCVLGGIYTVGDVAKLFKVTTRCIQAHVAAGHLVTRTLPGRAKFLAADLEVSLQKSGGAR